MAGSMLWWSRGTAEAGWSWGAPAWLGWGRGGGTCCWAAWSWAAKSCSWKTDFFLLIFQLAKKKRKERKENWSIATSSKDLTSKQSELIRHWSYSPWSAGSCETQKTGARLVAGSPSGGYRATRQNRSKQEEQHTWTEWLGFLCWSCIAGCGAGASAGCMRWWVMGYLIQRSRWSIDLGVGREEGGGLAKGEGGNKFLRR